MVWLLFLFIVAAPPFGKFPACLELTTQRDDRVGDHCYCLETWWQKFVPASSSPFSFNESPWRVIRWLDDYCFLWPSSTGFQPWRHQAGGPVWCWESRDPSCVSGAEFHHLHALDGGGRGQQVCKALLRSNQWLKGFWSLTYFCFEMSVCLSALGSFCSSEDESKLFLPKLPTLPKRYRQYLEHIVMSHTGLIL